MNDTGMPQSFRNVEPLPFEDERETRRTIVHALVIAAFVILAGVAIAWMTPAG